MGERYSLFTFYLGVSALTRLMGARSRPKGFDSLGGLTDQKFKRSKSKRDAAKYLSAGLLVLAALAFPSQAFAESTTIKVSLLDMT